MGCSGRWGRKLATWEDYRDADGGAVELGLVHVSNGGFGIGFIDVEYVRGASVCTELSAQGHVHVVNWTVLSKDLAQVLLGNILCQALDDNLGALQGALAAGAAVAAPTTEAACPVISAPTPSVAPTPAVSDPAVATRWGRTRVSRRRAASREGAGAGSGSGSRIK